MNDSGRLEQLRAIPMLADLPDDALTRLAARASDFEAPAGQVLVQANEPGSGVLILETGHATVELGKQSIDCVAGECIGELALILDDVVHVARVRAVTDVRGIAISRADFKELLADADIAGAVLRVLARRLVAADGMLAVGS
ncbi:MAG TPA: Crp/Fnr family transcriptional regulator [Acidimicrobiia bacterium]|jgi:CRP-like cAMP-binding protein|nr:Crp/Fnr family transcriptional regulator [Acidimicrobiia bacterium]